MNGLFGYFVTNFIVICVSIIMIIILSMKMKKHKRISIYLILVLGLTILITILDYLQIYVQTVLKNALLTTIIASFLYTARPVCVLLFILLSGQKIKHVGFYILVGLFFVNLIVNILPFIPATSKLVYYFETSDYDPSGAIHWNGGTIIRFVPHVVSFIYLLFLLYRSISLLKRKHFFDAFGIIACCVVVSIATILESFFNDDGSIYLLPASIVMGVFFYYLFLYERNNKMDALTGLFNRASYYDDVAKFGKDITGIIELDMNGLKYLNDTYGHLEGDKGLLFISQVILKEASRRMYSYRLGGDEFIIIAVKENEERIIRFVNSFKESIKGSGYYCSIGYAYKNKTTNSIDELVKLAEEKMYQDKAEFYKDAKFERRKAAYIDTKNDQ